MADTDVKVTYPAQEAPLTTPEILGHTLKDLGEALGPAELELLYTVTRNTLAQGGASAGTLAGQLHDLASGISPTSDLSAQNTAEAAAPTEYTPKLEVSQFLTGVGSKLLGKLGTLSKSAGEFVRSTAQAHEGKEKFTPAGVSRSALLGTAAEVGTDLLPTVAMRETPVSRFVKSRVTEPVKAQLGKAADYLQEKIHHGAYKASVETQQMLTEQAGKEDALRINLAQTYSAWKGQKVTAEENARILAYMEDPTARAPLTDRERVLYKTYIEPYAKALGWTPGYVHRIALEKPNAISALMGGFKSPSITPRLSTQESATESRELFRAQPVSKDQPPMVVSIKQAPFKNTYTATFFHDGEKVGMQEDLEPVQGSWKGHLLKDAHGNQYRVEDASISEIERHTNVRYVRNPMVMAGEAWREHHQKLMSQATLDKMKVVLGNNGLIASATDPKRPANFVPIDNYHFHGYVAHPAIARVVNAMVGQGGKVAALDAFNKAMLNASFVIPIWHQLNITAFAMSDELARASDPAVWRDVVKNMARAYKEVSTYGDDYMRLVNQGYPMMKARTMAPHDLKNLTESLLRETDSERFRGMASKAGVPVDMIRKGLDWFLYRWEHQPVWSFNDMATMRAIYDRMSADPKLTLEAAADDTFRNFPSYRIPYSSATMTGIQKSGLFWFLPYHLDRIRILWNRAGGAALGDTQAASQLMGTIIMQSVLFPELDHQLQKASGNKKASVVRFGEAEIPDKLAHIASRDASAWSAVGLMLTPTPPAQLLVSGAEYEATRKKHGKEPPLSEQAKAIGEDTLERSVYPIYDLKQAGWDPSAGILAQLGVKFPVTKKKGRKGRMGEPPLPRQP